MSSKLAGRRAFIYLVLVLVLLIIADGLVSQFLVSQGLGREGNPFLRGLIGGSDFLLVKIAGALLVGLILWDIFRRQPKVALFGAAFCVLLYTAIVYWNVGVLLLVGGLL